MVHIRATPPARPHHFSEDIKGRVKLYIQGNLQHVSTEFLGYHQIRTPMMMMMMMMMRRRRRTTTTTMMMML